MINCEKYILVISSANAPKCRGGKYRRPVNLRIIDKDVGSWHAIRGYGGLMFEVLNVDSRYSGPKSAYGQALIRAREKLTKLNKDFSDKVSECVVI